MNLMPYEIRVEKELDGRWRTWFGDLEIVYAADSDETILRGELVDQSALFGVLGRVRDLGLTLVGVARGPSTVHPNAGCSAQDDELFNLK